MTTRTLESDRIPKELYEQFANDGDPGMRFRSWEELNAREQSLLAIMCERATARALEWSDSDQPLPEDDAIAAAHPLKSGRHDLYQEAMRMVGAKRSKGALVDLVTWLLVRVEKAEGRP